MLKLLVWAYNKPPFLKLIKSFYVSLQSQFTCFWKSNINQTLSAVVVWYEEWGLQFSQKSDIWYKNWSPFCLFFDLKICAIQQLDYIKVSQYQLECNERGIVCNEACPNLSQLLRVWYFMRALKHTKQVSWIGIMVFWNRKEGPWLYHIIKLLILLFGFIMMFDQGSK